MGARAGHYETAALGEARHGRDQIRGERRGGNASEARAQRQPPARNRGGSFRGIRGEGLRRNQGRGRGHARAREKGLPYLYFKTKEELFKAVIRSVITSHFDVIREQMETHRPPCRGVPQGPVPRLHPGAGRLQARVHRAAPHRRRAQAPRAHRLLLRASRVSRGIETITRLIDRGIERGEFKPTKLRDYPQLLIAPVLTAIIWRGLFERHCRLDTDGLLRTNIELLTDAIRAPGRDPVPSQGDAR